MATLITDPKFQDLWHNVEQNTIGLEQFQLLLDPEINVKFYNITILHKTNSKICYKGTIIKGHSRSWFDRASQATQSRQHNQTQSINFKFKERHTCRFASAPEIFSSWNNNFKFTFFKETLQRPWRLGHG
jgi:hypothetical protein